MKNCTRSCTTHFLPSNNFRSQTLKDVLLPLYIVEGDIYRAYMHQNRFNRLIFLLNELVFVLVQLLVQIFTGLENEPH